MHIIIPAESQKQCDFPSHEADVWFYPQGISHLSHFVPLQFVHFHRQYQFLRPEQMDLCKQIKDQELKDVAFVYIYIFGVYVCGNLCIYSSLTLKEGSSTIGKMSEKQHCSQHCITSFSGLHHRLID